MPRNFVLKKLNLKLEEVTTYRMKGGTSAVCCTDKQEVYLHTSVHDQTTSGHYVVEEGNTLKPLCIESYSKNMGFVYVSNLMANSYIVSQKTWNWTRRLFFHFVSLTILNAFIIHNLWGAKSLMKSSQE